MVQLYFKSAVLAESGEQETFRILTQDVGIEFYFQMDLCKKTGEVRSERTSPQGTKSIAVGNAHGRQKRTMIDPERVEGYL